MPDAPNRVALDRVDWLTVLPVLRLASAFRHALQPGKLVVALLAVLLIHAGGSVLDLMWGEQVGEGEGAMGVYEYLVTSQADAFDRLVSAALAFDLGVGRDATGVIDVLRQMFVDIPGEAFDAHPWFTLLFGALVLLVLAITSGIICRMSATQLCINHTTSLHRAARFVSRRGAWYVLTPLMPTLLILTIAGVLIAIGFILFNLPWLEVLGSLFFGLLLVLGFVVALVAVLLVFALCLMPPALSVEGTDGFDAIARSFNYIMFKPWQFAGYLIGAIVYAAVVYVLVMSLHGFTIQATHTFVDVGAFTELQATDDDGVTTTTTRYRHLASGDRAEVGGSTGVSAWIVTRWLELLKAIAIAVMFSVVCCLQTQVYVMMRRCADGTPLDDCAADDDQQPWSSPKDLVDPEAQAIAEAGPGDRPPPSTDASEASDDPSDP